MERMILLSNFAGNCYRSANNFVGLSK